jgi:hypothetical protein
LKEHNSKEWKNCRFERTTDFFRTIFKKQFSKEHVTLKLFDIYDKSCTFFFSGIFPQLNVLFLGANASSIL